MKAGQPSRTAIFLALLSHWRRHKTQLGTLVAGLVLATALWTGVQAINAHARASYDQAAQTVGAGQRSVIRAPDDRPFDQALFAVLRRAGLDVTPVVTGTLANNRALTITGIDPLSFSDMRQSSYQPPAGEDMLAFLNPPGVLHVHPEAAAALETALRAIPAAARPTLTVDPSVPDNTAIGDIAAVQKLLDLDGKLTALWLPRGMTAADVVLPQELPAHLWDGLSVSDPVAAIDMAGLTDSFHLNLTAFGLLSFLVGLFIVYSAVGLALEARLPSIRTLRVCGVSRRRLISFLMLETVLIAVLAGTLGINLGFLIAQLLLPDVAASLQGLYGANVGSELSPGFSWWAAGIALSLLGALGAATGTYIRIYRMPVLTRPGSHAWRSSQQQSQSRQRLAGLGLWALAAIIYGTGESLMAAFLVVAGLLTGAALLLPGLLSALLALGSLTARGPVAQWFWADTRKQGTGLSLALMALLLALGTNIGVGGMVEGFRKTFTTFLDERLATELYVYAPDVETAADIRLWLETQENVLAVLPQWYTRGQYGNQPIDITGFSDHATFRDLWTLWDAAPDAWDSVFDGAAILVNEQLARRHKLAVSDSITLTTARGPSAFTVAGIYADYGNPKGAVRTALSLMEIHWPDAERRRMGARLTGDPAATVQALKDRFGLGDRQVTDQATLKGYSQAVFDKTFAITATLNVLTLGVAGVALFTSLLTLSGARLVDMAPVWTAGLSRTSLTRAEFAKILMLALLTCIAAVPLGVALCWCLVGLVNVEAFGWRLPLYLFPQQWGQLVALGCITAALASLYPLIRLHKVAPAQLTKVFANER